MATRENELFTGVLPFVTAARARSFRAAAKQLGVTPSAISKAISRLEAELGVQLLRRTARSVTLTSEGESFLRGCEGAVEQLRLARSQVSHAQGSIRGKLTVSLPVLLGAELIVPALSQLCERHPGLSLRTLLTDRFVDLAEERIDAVVRIGEVADSRLTVRRLRRLRWLTVAAPSYLAQRGVPQTIEQLSGHEQLGFLLPDGLVQSWKFCDREHVPSGRLVSDHGGSLIHAARAGHGIFQAHDYAVRAALARGELVELLAPFAAAGPPMNLLMAAGRVSARARAFGELILELLG